MNPFGRLKQYLSKKASSSEHVYARSRFGVKKIFYLPRISTTQEIHTLLFLAAIVLLSGFMFISRLYIGMTIPVPRVGASYTEGMMGDPHTINPIYASRDTDRDISRLIFSELLTYDGKGNTQPDLAERIDISSDGKTYTAILKKNLQWHDGEAITADDVVFTIHTIQNGQFRSPLRSDWQGVSVEKINDLTVRFSLRTPYAPFIENLTIGIIPKHVWQNVNPEQAPLHEANLKPVGSGPYRFDEFKQNKDGSISHYQIVRNSSYYRSGPYIKKIVFQFFKNEDEMFAAWRRGIIDGYGGVSPLHSAGINPDKFFLLSLNMPRIFGIFFNPRHAPLLEDFNVRQAVAYAIDRNEIAQSQRLTKVKPTEGPLPWFGGGSNATFVHPYNPDYSRELLARAGWKDINGDGILEKINKKKSKDKQAPENTVLRFTLTTSNWPDLVQTAAIVQRQLQRVGIDLIIEEKPYQELESNVIKPRNFEMLLFGHVYGYETDPFAFWHSSQIRDPGLNITFFSDKKADKLLEEIRQTGDAKIRDQAYRTFSDIIVKNIPAVFLFSQDYLYVLPNDIQGVSPVKVSLPSDRFNEINQWYRSMTRVFKWGK